ncbi:cytochrome c oxidase assembly protein [Phyllobacterium salinisoli]|nr:cytochrome c oxidase assembly protein [Phyllobacterium salinisoli]
MVTHIILMNACAPLIALACNRIWPANQPKSRMPVRNLLFPAMIVQLALLWAWHAPPALDAAMRSHALHLLMQASLFLGALWFWSAIFLIGGHRRWRAILALLITSKIFCLLGILFVFAPRTLYPAVLSGHHAAHLSGITVADQQLAGLLMLTACPATYVLAGIVIATLWFNEISSDTAASPVPVQEARA